MNPAYPPLKPRWRVVALCAAAFVNLSGAAVLAALVADEGDPCSSRPFHAGAMSGCTPRGDA